MKDLSSNTIYYNDDIGFKDLSSNLIHGDNFYKEYDKYNKLQEALLASSNNKVQLDCNNSKILDSFKTFFYNQTGQNSKIADIIKTNKVDNNTCDIKYNFEGSYVGQNTRRITFQYKPGIGYVCTNMDDEMSGLTLITESLDANNVNSVETSEHTLIIQPLAKSISPVIITLIVIGVIFAIAFIIFIYNKLI